MTLEAEQCPKCYGLVTVERLCPGYPQDGKWYQCYPPCGKATLWECSSIVTCGWWFIDGMHPKNKLFADNEMRRPTWLPIRQREGH